MKKTINLLRKSRLALPVSALILGVGLVATPALAQKQDISNGTITIPISEYDKLKIATEAKKDKQYWNMTFEQILDSVGNDQSKAWGLYEYWVLRRLSLSGTVSSGNVSSITRDIGILSEVNKTKPITIIVNSPGGYVYEGIMLLNAMETAIVPIHTVCDSMAASMAAVIVAAGDHRTANPGCHWMIHEVGTGGAPGGQTTDFVKWADFTVDLENILLQTIADKSGLSLADVRKLAEYETFYGAEDVLRLGIVDEAIVTIVSNVKNTIPEDLLPLNRMKRNLNEKLDR